MILISELKHLHTFSHITNPEKPEDTYVTLKVRPEANFLNDADSKLWDEVFKDTKVGKEALEKGWLLAVEDPQGKKGKGVKKRNDIPESLDGLDTSMKKSIIQTTVEAEPLRNWMDEESDSDIKKLLVNQLKRVKQIDDEREAIRTGRATEGYGRTR